MTDTNTQLLMRQRSWSRYWSSGALHSCADSFGGKFGPSTTAFWNRVFRLLGVNDRVLELGTGNGALVQFLHERYLQGNPLRVDAIDLAQIAPPWLERVPPAMRRWIGFHSGVRIESLPFDARSFSYVVGQYAIEYAEWDTAWHEVLRVCRPICRIGMILHHHDSLPVRACRVEGEHCRWLLAEEGPYALAEHLVPYMAMAATEPGRQRLASDADAAALRERYNAKMGELLARAQAWEFPDLLLQAAEGLNEVFQQARKYGREPARELLAAQLGHLRDALLRLDEARDCALDGAAMADVAGRLHRAGFETVEYAPLTEQGALFGWSLYAHRPH